MARRVPCEKCGNMVADTARKCPYCGKHPNVWRNRLAVVIIVIVALLIVDDIYAGGSVRRALLAILH